MKAATMRSSALRQLCGRMISAEELMHLDRGMSSVRALLARSGTLNVSQSLLKSVQLPSFSLTSSKEVQYQDVDWLIGVVVARLDQQLSSGIGENKVKIV